MDTITSDFVYAGDLDELKVKGRLVVRGRHRPILLIYKRSQVLALDNRCPHMGFPLERGSIDDGVLTCHWHHARFALESGCTFLDGRPAAEPFAGAGPAVRIRFAPAESPRTLGPSM